MKRLLWVLLCSTAFAASSYQTGKLVGVNDSRSNRTIGNAQSGNIQTVTDVEYRLSVEVGDTVYVGSYWPRWKWSYAPSDFIVNDPVQARIEGKHMYIKRPDGKELKTEIIRRIHRPN